MATKIQTVTEQVYREIRREIFHKTLRPGEKLTIKMLNERYGVSSSPIREALARLQQDGLIDYKPNVGMRVIQLTERDIEELYEFTSELDAMTLRIVMKSDRVAELIDRLSAIQQQAQAHLDDDAETWNSFSETFHLTLYEFANNSRLTDAAVKVRSQFTILTQACREDKSTRESILAEHQSIIDAITRNEAARAEELMREHVCRTRDKVIKSL